MDASSSSSMSTPAKIYDVFLSFRGEDTREKFTSHLHDKLRQKNLDTYIDYRISKGGDISKELIKAIEGSRISVIIFSENYASSSWCLDELVRILKCKKERGQIVVPVFYEVEPRNVRKQLKSYEAAFAKHKKERAAGKVEKWRAALMEAGSIKGWDSETYEGTESEFVEAVAKDILVKVNDIYSSTGEFRHLVGIGKSIVEMGRLLCIDDSTSVRMIGIWGMGGLGKTTLARVLFKRLSSKFQGCCFLANVREESGKRDGLESLETKLFSELLKENDLDSTFSKDKLRYKRVLLVLDDVDDPGQLQALAADHDWFGPGSRIIVTTRDTSTLRERADEIYELKRLGYDDALKLFKMNAYKSSPEDDDDAVRSQRLVKATDGNPLALKVFGCFLRSKKKENWDIELKKLKEFPDKSIHNVLKVSFDGLHETEKAIFLDIACIFKAGLVTCRKFVERILGSHRSYVHIGIDSLIDKSLIAVKGNELMIHDLLQEMGWEIERRECKLHTRFWHEELLYDALKNNTVTSSTVEVISCYLHEKRRDWIPTMFEGMHGLWLLHIKSIFCSSFPQVVRYLPASLKCLLVDYSPWQSLPPNFMAHSLVELRMPHSKLEKLWSGAQNLGSLKYVDLSWSVYLTEISALSQAPNLVSVDLRFCKSIHQVPPLRFQIDDKLTTLDQSRNNCYHDECNTRFLQLDFCSSLEVIEEISGNLRELHLCHLSSIEKLSIFSLCDLDCLILRNCHRLKSLPSDIQMLKSLQRLCLSGCSSFNKLPVLPGNLIELDLTETSIKQVPSSSIEHLSCLERLTLNRCRSLKSLPSDMQMLKSLQHLYLIGCFSFNKLSVLPGKLIELDLTETSIEQVSSASIEHLSSLERLTLNRCRRLKSLPSDMQMLKSLQHLYLIGCFSFNKLPVLPGNLIELDLTETSIEQVPSSSIEHLSCLERLTLNHCRSLKSLPSDMQMLKSLQHLYLIGCSSFNKLPVLPGNLIELDLTETSIDQVPSSSIEHLSSLERLTLNRSLKSLPSDIQMLKSLRRLDLNGWTHQLSLSRNVHARLRHR